MMDVDNYCEGFRVDLLTEVMSAYIDKRFLEKNYKGIIVLGIGTNRFPFDSYGPLTVSLLEKYNTFSYVKCFGTMDEPLHALNIEEFVSENKEMLDENLVIAVDAIVGSADKLGKIEIFNKGIKPGAGCGKKIERVGDLSICGYIVRESNCLTDPATTIEQVETLSIPRDHVIKLSRITAGILDIALSEQDIIIRDEHVYKKVR